MNNAHKIGRVRILTLSVVFLSVVGTSVQLLLSSGSSDRNRAELSPLEFPNAVELPSWQSLSSYSITPENLNDEARIRFISAQAYQYQQGDRLLNIEMFYIKDNNGKASNFLADYTSVTQNLVLSSQNIERYRERVGYYVLFADREHAYLTSCINPRGESTVTLERFNENRYRYDIRFDRLWRWFLASGSIRDFRCIWVNMSISLDGVSTEESFSTLENAWFYWHEWWQPRFPGT